MVLSNLTVLQINQKFRKSEAQISADYFHFPAQSYSFSLTSLTDQGALKSCTKTRAALLLFTAFIADLGQLSRSCSFRIQSKNICVLFLIIVSKTKVSKRCTGQYKILCFQWVILSLEWVVIRDCLTRKFSSFPKRWSFIKEILAAISSINRNSDAKENNLICIKYYNILKHTTTI